MPDTFSTPTVRPKSEDNQNARDGSVESSGLFSAAQLWYVATVYPEPVKGDEAESEERWKDMPESYKDYWRAAVCVLTRIYSENAKLTCAGTSKPETKANL